MKRLQSFLALLFLSLFLSGCTTPNTQEAATTVIKPAEKTEQADATIIAEEKFDPSCAYFYFLWGSNAEYDERYEEALEAYEKASICDPEAEYIAEKIPVLLIQLGRLKEASIWLENYLNKKPTKTVQRFMLARLKIQQGKETEAINLYRDALKLEPDNDIVRLRLGLLHTKRNENQQAEEIFSEILEESPDSYFAILYLSRLYVKTGRLSLAEQYYTKALTLNWSQELSFEIAEFYSLRKQFKKAGEIYKEVLKKDEQSERAALGLVQTSLFLNEGDNALEELLRIRQFSRVPTRIDIVRSQILINMGKFEEAKEILHSINEEQQLAQVNYLLGIIYFEEEEYKDALKFLKEVSEDSKEYIDAAILQVRIYDKQDNSSESISLLQKIILDEENRQPVFFSLLANFLQQQEKNTDALEILAQGVQLFPQDKSLLYDYGTLLEKNKNHDKAIIQMEKVLSIDPNHADALNFIGYSWADRNVNLDKAFEYIQKALELKPDSGYILDSLGWVYFRLKKYDMAQTELKKAFTILPEDPYISIHLGDTLMALEDREQALFYYKKALELSTDENILKSLREKLKKINEN